MVAQKHCQPTDIPLLGHSSAYCLFLHWLKQASGEATGIQDVARFGVSKTFGIMVVAQVLYTNVVYSLVAYMVSYCLQTSMTLTIYPPEGQVVAGAEFGVTPAIALLGPFWLHAQVPGV